MKNQRLCKLASYFAKSLVKLAISNSPGILQNPETCRHFGKITHWWKVCCKVRMVIDIRSGNMPFCDKAECGRGFVSKGAKTLAGKHLSWFNYNHIGFVSRVSTQIRHKYISKIGDQLKTKAQNSNALTQVECHAITALDKALSFKSSAEEYVKYYCAWCMSIAIHALHRCVIFPNWLNLGFCTIPSDLTKHQLHQRFCKIADFS